MDTGWIQVASIYQYSNFLEKLMSKIKLKIERDNKEHEADQASTGRAGIKKKIEGVSSDYSDGQQTQSQEKYDSAKIADMLFQVIGKQPFEFLKENKDIRLPYTEMPLSVQQWLSKVLDTVFTPEQLQESGTLLAQKNAKGFSVVQEPKPSAENIHNQDIAKQYEMLKQDYETLRTKKQKLEVKLKSAIDAEILINVIFSTFSAPDIEDGLLELVKAEDENNAKFLTVFSKEWTNINNVLLKNKSLPEQEKVEKVHKELTVLLSELSGIHVPQRRIILDRLADYVSAQFQDFTFISPEESLQVDPAIHNAKGVGGTRVKEGRSFAVIRKNSGQVYIYADIIV